MNHFTGAVLMSVVLAGWVAHAEVTAVCSAERPWGDSFVPRSSKPADIIRVVSLQGLDPDEKIALCCLQGLLAYQSERDPSHQAYVNLYPV